MERTISDDGLGAGLRLAPAAPQPQPGPPADDRPLRICLLGYRSHPHSGGQGIYLRFLSRALRRLGHSVDVISGEPYPELDDDVPLIEMPGLNLYASSDHIRALRRHHLRSYTDTFEWLSMATGGFPEPYTFGRRASTYLAGRRTHYDLVHDNQSLGYGLLALRRMGIPVLATIHHPITRDRDLAVAGVTGWGHRLAVRRWYSFLRMQGRVARRLDRLVTVSESSRRDIASAFRVPLERISVVPNGIDSTLFHPLSGVVRQPRRIMTIASADAPLKGLAYLLRAAGRLRTRYPDLEVLVIGRLNPRGPTARLVRELGLEGTVQFRGGLDASDIVVEYARATVAVVPSLYEGFGLPAGEAMASGVPVIATTGGALPEVVGDAGLLVPPGDENALASAIAHLLESPAERARLASAGRERVLERFCWDRAAQHISACYRALLAAQIAPA